MANRVVAVTLRSEIGSYVAGMTKAALVTREVGDHADATGKKAKQGFDLAGKASVLMGGAVVGALYGMVTKTAEFEKSMSAVSAATGSSGAALDGFRDAAMKAGADSQYSATEAADAITEMAKAGVSAKDILGGGLTGALDLAAAGQLDVADAAGIASIAMTQFNLAGEDLPHVADLLAAGAGKAMGSVDDLGAALNQSGLIASAAGLSIEETTGTLAAFASAGLIGSDSGTSFKTMLQAIQAPSGKAAEIMDDLGIKMYDASGNMLGASEMAGQLQEGLGGLTEEQRNSALATIFGSDAVRAANVLYKEGAAGIQEWINKTNDAGYASDQAAALTDNLAGDVERLGGALDTAFIQSGGAFTGILRELAQGLTGVVNGASALMDVVGAIPGPIIAAAAAFGAFLLLRGPLNTMLETLSVNIMSTVTGMGMAASSAGGFKGAMSGLAGAINPAMVGVAAGAVLVQSITSQMAKASSTTDEWAQALLEGGAAAQTAAAQYKQSRDDAFGFDWMKDLDEWSGAAASMDDAKQAAKELYDAMTPLEQGQVDVTIATNNLSAAIDRYGKGSPQARDAANELALANQDLATKQGQVKTATDEATTALAQTPEVMANAYDSLTNYAAALGLDKDATEELRKKTEDLGKSLADFVNPLGVYTGMLDEKKAAEEEAARKAAESAGASAESWRDFVVDTGFSFDEYMRRLEEQVAAQANWQTNMLLLAGQVSQGTLEELARMGPEGAPLVADLVNRSDAELDRFDEITAQRSKEATDAWGAQLTLAAPVLAAVGKTAGQGVVASLVEQLQAGTITVGQIAAQYGVNLAGGINPILTSLGKPAIQGTRAINGRAVFNADGSLYEDHQAEIAPGGAWRVWAEPETGGEAYIPLSASKRDRSMNIWRETGKRLGAPEAQYYANGGFTTSGDVPKPSSTAPYGAPISTAADGTMQAAYAATTAWLDANVASGSIAGPAGSGGGMSGTWTSIAGIVRAAIPQARINSTYRPGDPGYHGRNKAVDFGFGSGPGGAGSAGLASIARFLYSGYGRSLAEIIYDGIGDNTPDVKNGRDHVYNAATRAEHRNHVHAAVYDSGGWLQPGYTLAYNGTGANERVLTSREFSAGAGGSGGGSAGGGNVVVQARVFIGDREITDIVRVESSKVVAGALGSVLNRGGYNPS